MRMMATEVMTDTPDLYRKAEVAADDEILDDDAVLMWVVPVEPGFLIRGDFDSVSDMIEALRQDPVTGVSFTRVGGV